MLVSIWEVYIICPYTDVNLVTGLYSATKAGPYHGTKLTLINQCHSWIKYFKTLFGTVPEFYYCLNAVDI